LRLQLTRSTPCLGPVQTASETPIIIIIINNNNTITPTTTTTTATITTPCRYENESSLLECEGCGDAAPDAAAGGGGGVKAGGFVVGLLQSAEGVPGKDKLKVQPVVML